MSSNPVIDIHQHMFTANLGEDGKPIINLATGMQSTAFTDQELILQTLILSSVVVLSSRRYPLNEVIFSISIPVYIFFFS